MDHKTSPPDPLSAMEQPNLRKLKAERGYELEKGDSPGEPPSQGLHPLPRWRAKRQWGRGSRGEGKFLGAIETNRQFFNVRHLCQVST